MKKRNYYLLVVSILLMFFIVSGCKTVDDQADDTAVESVYAIAIKMTSTTQTDTEIYSIDMGEKAIFKATVTKNSKPLVHEIITFSGTKGAFVNIADGEVLTDENGIAEIVWITGDIPGAGTMTATIKGAIESAADETEETTGETEETTTESTKSEIEKTRTFYINPSEIDSLLQISAELLSKDTGELFYSILPGTGTGVPFYGISQGQEGTLVITAKRGERPAAHEMLTVESTMGTFIGIQNKTVLTDNDGKVSLTWRAGNESGGGSINISSVSGEITLNPALKFMIKPFDSSESSDQADQDSFTFGVVTPGSYYAVEGLVYVGEKINVAVYVADRYNHKVREGTLVHFYTEGGEITETSTTNADGICNATWRSQEPIPEDGRVTVMAVTKGNESFLDANNDSVYTHDTDVLLTDMEEAFLDANENGIYDFYDSEGLNKGREFSLDNNGDSLHTKPDGLYNGSLCVDGKGCTDELIDIRSSLVIVMSGSAADISLTPSSISLNATSTEKKVTLTIQDENGNTMPHTSEVKISSPEDLAIKRIDVPDDVKSGIKDLKGKDTNEVTFQIVGSLEPLKLSFYLYIPEDGLESGVDINGDLTVEVTTPKGNVTSKSIVVTAYVPEPEEEK